MRAKRTKAASRKTLARLIRAEPDIRRKLVIAADIDYRLPAWHISQEPGTQKATGAKDVLPLYRTNAELLGLVEELRRCVGSVSADTAGDTSEAEIIHPVVYEIGMAASVAILCDDYNFFSRMAAILQHGRRPNPHRLYYDLLLFCLMNDCGTQRSPCNPWELLDYLRAYGHTFTQTDDNQLPRTLHALCRRLGIHLLARKPGRPRKNLQR